MAITNRANLSSKITSESGEQFDVSAQSNALIVYDLTKDVTIEKSAEREWTLPGSRVIMTTTITNNMDVQIDDVTILDSLGSDATFVEGTLKAGSQQYPDDNPITGATLPVTIGAQGGQMEFSYEVEVAQTPLTSSFDNISNITATIAGNSYTMSSNEVTVHILENEIYLLKTADKIYVKPNDVVTFTIKISNAGTLTNTDVVLFDPIPEGATFVAGSVKVGGTEYASANPADGISIHDLSAGDEVSVEFKVTID